MTTPPRRVGILGGMGPQATVWLMSRIIALTHANTPAQDDCDHVPLLVDNNTQVPSRIQALLHGTGADPGPVLADMARRLEAAGCQALAMPCNTAHHYAAQIQAAVAIPLLNMVTLAVDAAAQAVTHSGRQPVGILASPAVQRTGLFDGACATRGLQTLYPDPPDALLACIQSIKRHGDSDEARRLLNDAALALHATGAAVVLIACSELSIIQDAVPEHVAALDTLDVLAGAVVNFAIASNPIPAPQRTSAPPPASG